MLARNCDLCWLASSSCRPFSSMSAKSRAFWMASTDCAANVSSSDTVASAKAPGARRRTTSAPIDAIETDQRDRQQRAVACPVHDAHGRRQPSFAQVRHLHRLARRRRLADRPVAEANGLLSDGLDHLLAHAVGGAQPELLAQIAEHVDGARVGARELHRLGHDRVEHRLQIERRVHRLRHLAERLQLLDRARQLARARLHLVEQPHVLDGDHRLVGEGRDQLDLLLGERLHGSAASAR